MEDQTYSPLEEEQYRAQYEYQNMSNNEGGELPNYCEYVGEEGAEYPIGDGQDIDALLLSGDYACEGEYADYRQTRSYVPERTVKGIMESKYNAGFTLPRRGQVLPQRASTYYTNEVGDYRRSTLNDKVGFGSYPQRQTPEYALSKLKRDSLLRSLTDKDYHARIHKLRENRLKQDRLAAGGNYYTQPAPLTHDQLQDTFMKNYKMDTRKPTQATSATPQVSRNISTPRSDTAAMREFCYANRKRYIARNLEKEREDGATKDTNSEPVPPRATPESKYVKTPGDKTYAKVSPASVQPAQQYVRSVNYEAMLKAAQKSSKLEDTDLEVKYKNDEFDKSNQGDTDVGCQEREVPFQIVSVNEQSSTTSISQLKEDTSDDKIPVKGMNKLRISARSNRSKRSSHTGRSKGYEDLVKLQKSKCTVMSVIYDGIQKCEQSKYEFPPSTKYNKDEGHMERPSKQSQTDQQAGISQDKSVSSSVDIMNSEIISKMFKEFRDYHLQNISQEVKRLQYLEVLPQKITHLHGS